MSENLALTNEEKNEGVITSGINLTDEVKIVIDNLINEQFRHQDYQSDCFEKLINIWLGEKFLETSSTLDINQETERFEINCKDCRICLACLDFEKFHILLHVLYYYSRLSIIP